MNTHTFYKMPFDSDFDPFDYTLENMSEKSTYCLNTCLENNKLVTTKFTKTESNNDDYHNKRLKNNSKSLSKKFSSKEIDKNKQVDITPDIVHIETPAETFNNYRYNKKNYK